MKEEALLFPPPLYSSFISVAMHHLEKVASSWDVGDEGNKGGTYAISKAINRNNK